MYSTDQLQQKIFQHGFNELKSLNDQISSKFEIIFHYNIGKQKLMFSKETLDKVKLAKQYIENKYQGFIDQEERNQQNWKKILTLVQPCKDNLEKITQKIVADKSTYTRLQRHKDCLKNYKLYNIIGKGAFGQVRLARNINTNEVVAIKRLQKEHLIQKKQIYNAYLEKDFLSKNKSHFIVQLKSTFQDQNYLYITMEYVQGGDLLHLLIEKDILSEDQTRFYIAELTLAIQQIHKMNYIHRDIKPDNILIDRNGHVKISDFGLSKYLGDSQKQNIKISKTQKVKKLSHLKSKQKIFSKVGTPDYISPEVLVDKTYSQSIDLWGIGVIMYQCLYGFPPFSDEDSKQVCHKVANWFDYLQFPEDIQVSNEARSLLLGLIAHKQKRLTIKQIKKHPFFDGINWQNIDKTKAPFIPAMKSEVDTSNFDSYQITKPWNEQQRQLCLDFQQIGQKDKKQIDQNQTDNLTDSSNEKQQSLKQKKQRKTVGPKFRFAGFDFIKREGDPLQVAARQLERKSCPIKTLKKKNNINKITSIKNLKIETNSSKNAKNSQKTRKQKFFMKNRLSKGKKSTQKTRPSEMLSVSVGRFSTVKQILRATRDQYGSRNPHQMLQQCSSPKQKKKNNNEKMKQLYYQFSNKLQLKRKGYAQARNKTQA